MFPLPRAGARFAIGAVLVAFASACSGGESAAPPVVARSAVRAAPANVAAVPAARSQASGLVDWPTYAFDAQRSGFNPATTAFTPQGLGALHLAWYASIGTGSDTQPIVATNVAGHAAIVIVGGGNGRETAYDALSGTRLWSTYLGGQQLGACGIAGVAGTAQYDASLGAVFVAAGNGGAPNNVVLYRLAVASGAITGQVDVSTLLPGESTFAHTSVTLANGQLYLGTSSNCEAASWRGQVISVDPSALAVTGRFFTTWEHGGHFGGGGVWGWGGVSADPAGNIYVATGNAETHRTVDSGSIAPPFKAAPDERAGFAEHLVQLSADLTRVESAQAPVFDFALAYDDLDYAGTPVLFQPPGCDLMSATQGKGGKVEINDTTDIKATPAHFQFSTPSAVANYVGNPAYSPVTGLLYAAISSSTDSLAPPGIAALGSCGKRVSWTSQFGPDSFGYTGATPRSAPTVTAGGVVFLGTACTPNGSGGCGAPGAKGGALWAVDAATGTVLGGGNPLLITGDDIRMAPSIDGQWLWLIDDSGNLYALTLDPSVPTLAARPQPRMQLRAIHWHSS